jgi:SAM-dependent methyltransferase
MKKLYQRGWFDIEFDQLDVSISEKNIAGVDFYTAFYREFYKRFGGYDDLPSHWIKLKDEIIDHLSGLLQDGQQILSIGCGTGYVEYKLSQLRSLNIVAIDPGVGSVWIDKDKINFFKGLFPEIIENKYQCDDFDLIFASGIDYVFNDEQYLRFLKSIVDFGAEEFFLTEIFIPNNDKLDSIKSTIKNVLSFFGMYSKGQFWGYLRNIKEHKALLTKAGFNSFTVGKYNHGGYWIMAKVLSKRDFYK